MIHEGIALAVCTPAALMDHLKSLGVFRLVAEEGIYLAKTRARPTLLQD